MHVIDIVLPTVFLVAEFLGALSVRQLVCAADFPVQCLGTSGPAICFVRDLRVCDLI